MVIDESLMEKVRSFACSAEKKSRFEHSIRVAETAARMCRVYGLDEQAGYFAGLSHDICKDMEDSRVYLLALKDGMPLCDEEKSKHSLLHGRAAAVMLASDFGVCDADILQSVALHTFGGVNMCPLAKIIFAADKIEPGRPQSGTEYLDVQLRKPLNEMTLFVLQENITYLEKNGKKPAAVSLEFRDSLLNDIKGVSENF